MRNHVDPFGSADARRAGTNAVEHDRSRHDQPHPREVEQPKQPPTYEPPGPREVEEDEPPPGFKPPERREVEQPEGPPDIEPGREEASGR